MLNEYGCPVVEVLLFRQYYILKFVYHSEEVDENLESNNADFADRLLTYLLGDSFIRKKNFFVMDNAFMIMMRFKA